MIDDLFRAVPTELLDQSGTVFYSGRDAFNRPSRLYVLGLNPGGSSPELEGHTLAWHSNLVLHEKPANWSAYRDESWQGAPPGTWGMQPRVLHLLRRLGFDPGLVPSSNLIFVRSRREAGLKASKRELAEKCWSFHKQAINSLRVDVVLCFGTTVGNWVCKELGARELVETFIENNSRRWTSRAFRSSNGVAVVSASHPSIAAWNTPAADPTCLVEHLLS